MPLNATKNNTDLFLQASTETDVKVNTDRRMVKKISLSKYR
jgi:hypothetical protein